MTKTILITGAGGGLGAALAKGFSDEGYQVYAGVREVSVDYNASGNIIPLELDTTNPTHVVDAVKKIEQSGCGLTALINNAGIYAGGPIECVPEANVRRVFEVNFFGTLAVTQAFLPLFRQQKTGRILLISSLSGLVALPCDGIYAASKHALEAIAESLFVELGRWNIDVQLVEPGAFESGLTDQRDCLDAGPYRGMTKSDEQKLSLPSTEEMAEEIIHLLERPVHSLRHPIGDQARSVFSQLGLDSQTKRQQFISDVSGSGEWAKNGDG